MSRTDLSASAAPLYEKVKQYILDKINQGEWGGEARLPGEPELARELEISRMTINRAMRELTDARVLERVPGVGTFVAAPSPAPAVVKIHNIADEIVARGQRHGSRVYKLEREFPPRFVHEAMELSRRRKIYHSVIVHYANSIPAQLEDRYVLSDFAPDYVKQDFTKMTTTDYLYSITPPTRAEHLIEAVAASEEMSGYLRIKQSEPCLMVTRRTWVGPILTSYMRMVHPGSRYRLLGGEGAVSP